MKQKDKIIVVLLQTKASILHFCEKIIHFKLQKSHTYTHTHKNTGHELNGNGNFGNGSKLSFICWLYCITDLFFEISHIHPWAVDFVMEQITNSVSQLFFFCWNYCYNLKPFFFFCWIIIMFRWIKTEQNP
jgi:hypothetical protein